jgi:hypothetical protein
MSIQTGRFVLLLFALLCSLVRPAAAQNPSPPAYNPVNGHWYQEYRTGGLTFQQARAAAASLTYAGFPGHLVTVTSPEEHQFLLSQVIRQGGEHWIGLYQDRSAYDYREPDGGWRWITGEPYGWNNWRGEPNNAHGNEDVVVMRGGESWNDLSYTDQQYGYIVEFEPQPFPGSGGGVRIALSPNPVVGGQGVAGQLTLDQPAGVGGVVITLTSSNPAAAVTAASVTVPAGAFTAPFPVVTFAVSSVTPVTISAVCLGIHSSATLQVLPREGVPALPPGHGASSPVYNGANEHWYQLIRTPGEFNWPDARAAAQSLSFGGYRGHLATITSAAERDFINTQVTGGSDLYAVWLGGYQDPGAPDYQEPDRGWRWVTGEPFQYTNWHGGEPNDSPRNSNALQLAVIWGGEWDDRLNGEARLPGYIVEYELSPGVPPVPPFGNLLVNGSFEDPRGSPHGLRNLPGWRMTRGTVDILTEPGWQAAHGQQMIDLVGTPGAATIEQSFGTEPGREYLFSGWISRNPEVSEGRANVYLNGQFFVQLYHREPGVIHRNMQWVPFAYRFRSAAPVTTLTLEDVTNLWDAGGGIFLDGLSVALADAPPPPAPLAAPSNLVAEVVSNNQVNLTWTDNSINETGFAVYRREGGGPWTRIVLVGPNVTRFADLDVRPGIVYAYRVQAVRDGEVSAWSNEASTAPAPPPPPPPAPSSAIPAAPSDLTARAVSHVRVELSWRDNSTNETAFALCRKGGGPLTQSLPGAPTDGDWVRIAVLTPNQTSYADRSVQPETAYVYRVRAIGKEGASAWSNEAPVTTPFDNGEPLPPGPPTTPTGFAAKAVSSVEVHVSWAKYVPGANGIGIWRKTGSGAWAKIANPPTQPTTYKDRNAKPNTTYTYRARAHNNKGASDWTPEVTVTTPPLAPVPVEQQKLSAPTDLAAQATGPNAVLLTWQDNSSDETAFAIFRRLGAGAPQRVGTAPPNATRFTDTSALPGRRYFYHVVAHNNSWVSYSSDEVTVVTPAQ